VGTGWSGWCGGSRMVGVSASVSLPLHHKVQKLYSGTGSPGWSQKKGHKTVVVFKLLLYFYSFAKSIVDEYGEVVLVQMQA